MLLNIIGAYPRPTRNLRQTIAQNGNLFGSQRMRKLLQVTQVVNEQEFGADAIVVSKRYLAQSRLVNDNEFGSDTILNLDRRFLFPTRVANANAFGSPSLTITRRYLRPAQFAETNSFGAHTLAVSRRYLSPAQVVNASAFGADTISKVNVPTDPPVVHDHANGSFSGTNTGTLTLANVASDDILVFVLHCEKNNASTVFQQISTITDTGGFTWQRRKQLQYSDGSGTPIRSNVEMWWAHATSAVSSNVITVTLSASTDDAAFAAFRVTGAKVSNPWDTNVSLPATASHAGGAGSSNASVSGISTTSPKPLVLAVFSSPSANLSGGPSGYTLIESKLNSGGTNFSRCAVDYRAFTSAQSGLSQTWSNAQESWGLIADAMTG